MSQSPPPAPLSLPASNPKKRPSQSSGPPISSQPPKKPRVQHPLRQTSFPASADTDPRVYSGSAGGAGARSEVDGGSVTGSFTGSLAGSFVGSADGKARGKKKGKKEREGAASVRAGRSARGGAAGTEDEEDDEDELDDADLVGEEDDGATDAVAEKENLAVLIDAFTPEQGARYDLFKRTKLNKPTLRKIVNQTLSQSVPPAVITTVSGFTKVFIGEMIEKARTAQSEWADAAERGAIEDAERAEAEEAERAAKKAAEEAKQKADRAAAAAAAAEADKTQQTTAEAAENGQSTAETTQEGDTAEVKAEIKEENASAVKSEQAHPEQNIQSITPHTPQQQPPPSTQSTVPDTPSQSFSKKPLELPNAHRGPLLPSHLREAQRRIKRAAEGGNVGYSGLSMNGYGVKGSLTWSVRGGGGRRLFR